MTRVSAVVRQAAQDIDAGASGAKLAGHAEANGTLSELVHWALELQSIPRVMHGNYLNAWYHAVYAWDASKALEIGQKIADNGVDFGLTAYGFTQLDHIDPKEPLPPALAPDVAQTPWGNRVDNFSGVRYDISYRPRSPGRLSTFLQLSYADGATLDLELELISDNEDPAQLQAIAHSYVGPAGRVFPLRLDRTTTPRRWNAQGHDAARDHDAAQGHRAAAQGRLRHGDVLQ